MKRGLVLEGGAMRGMFSAGVLDVMMERGVRYDGIIGVSAGAVFGCNYKSHQPGRVLRYNLRFCRDPRYCSFRSFLKTGDLYGAEFCYRVIPEELDVFDVEAYRADPSDFYVVAADVETGKAVYHNCLDGGAEDLKWIRASASMPLAAQPVEIDGRRYLDGGMADSIPLRQAEKLGFEKNVVVLTQPMGFVKERNRMMPVMRAALRKYPRLLETMARRHEVYNETIAYIREQERRGEVFVIRPEAPLGIGKVEHDPERIQEVYDLGRAVMEKRWEALQAFLREA